MSRIHNDCACNLLWIAVCTAVIHELKVVNARYRFVGTCYKFRWNRRSSICILLCRIRQIRTQSHDRSRSRRSSKAYNVSTAALNMMHRLHMKLLIKTIGYISTDTINWSWFSKSTYYFIHNYKVHILTHLGSALPQFLASLTMGQM